MRYNIYHNSSSPVPIDTGHLVTSGITETNYTDCGNVYNRYYAVTAVNENGESELPRSKLRGIGSLVPQL